jgi:hypothetical protein
MIAFILPAPSSTAPTPPAVRCQARELQVEALVSHTDSHVADSRPGVEPEAQRQEARSYDDLGRIPNSSWAASTS